MAVLGREVEDMAVVMLQFWGGRLRIWGWFCGRFRQGCEDTGVVMSQFLVEDMQTYRRSDRNISE